MSRDQLHRQRGGTECSRGGGGAFATEQDAGCFHLANCGLALIKYANDHDGAIPQDLDALEYFRGNVPQNVELIYRGNFHDIKYPERTILARTAQVKLAVDGSVARGYVLGNGQVIGQGAKSIEELDAWEKAFTNFPPDAELPSFGK